MVTKQCLDGTMADEFYIGKGDIDTPSENIIGFRTNGGIAEYKESGGEWKPFGFDENRILVSSGGDVVTNNDGNVLISSE